MSISKKRWPVVAILGIFTLACGPISYSSSGSGGDSPIKIRGGAMTFVTKSWSPAGPNSSPGQTSYCGSIPTSTLTLKDFDTNDFSTAQTLGTAWTIKLYHSDSTMTTDTKDGVEMVYSGSPCPGSSSGNSVTITPFGSGESYPVLGNASTGVETPLPSGMHFRRFMDKTCTDQDLCERISAIDVILPSSTTRYNCTELDCTVQVGLPVKPIQ